MDRGRQHTSKGAPRPAAGGGPSRRFWERLWFVAFLGIAGVLGMLWPRVVAYDGAMAENEALRTKVASIEASLHEAEQMMARLRLYDAQLKSLGGARGDHGPLPDETLSNAGLDGEEGEEAPSVGAADTSVAPLGYRPAQTWADQLLQRLEAFSSDFELGEDELNALLADLESQRAIRAALPSIWPAEGTRTSGFGWRSDPVHGRTRFHSGIDVANARGTPIKAAAPGKVIQAGFSSGYGRVVVLDHGFGITTKYAHLSTIRVHSGQEVKEGQFIATMGSTGKSPGPHLHFELRIDGSAVDPLKYLPR